MSKANRNTFFCRLYRNIDSKSEDAIFYGWYVVFAGWVILLLEGGCQFSYGVFLTELCADLNWDKTTISGAYSLFYFWHGAIGFIAGKLNDKYGPRITLLISIITYSIGYLLMFTVNAPWQIYLYYGIIAGTGFGFCVVPILSTVSHWFVKKRGIALGIAASGVGMGTLLIAPFTQFIVTRFGWRTSFVILAGILVIIGLPISRLMRLNPAEKGLLPYGVAEELTIEKKQSDKLLSNTVNFSLKQAINTKEFLFLLIAYAFAIFAVQMVMIHLKAYAIGFGITEMISATIIGFIGGASVVGRVMVGNMTDRIGRMASLSLCYVLLAVSMIWLIKARQPYQFYLFSVIFGFGYGGFIPIIPDIIAYWFGAKSHGSILGLSSMAAAIGGTFGPIVAGYIRDITGSYKLAIIIAVVVLFIALIFSLFIKEKLVYTELRKNNKIYGMAGS